MFIVLTVRSNPKADRLELLGYLPLEKGEGAQASTIFGIDTIRYR